jgi:hypothetical protein
VLIKFDTSNHDAVLWAGMLLVQTLPYWAAVYISAINALPKRPALAVAT